MKQKIPQRKPNKTMNGDQMLRKAVTGNYTKKPEKVLKEEELGRILKK